MNGTTNNTTSNDIVVPRALKWAWGPLDFHSLVVFSLIFQFSLFFGAPLRKFTTSGTVHLLVWSTYLLADWVSYYAVGLLVNNQSGPDRHYQHVIWGSILIGHMAGPHTISVLDMEDHKLWSRTALKFGTIAVSLAKVSIKAFTRRAKYYNAVHANPSLYVPAATLFIVAVIKGLEQITTLVFSRKSVIQDRILRKTGANSSNSKLVQGAVLIEVGLNGISRHWRRGKLSQFGALRDAYTLFQVSQGSYVDFKFKFTHDGGRSIKEYFLERSPEDAFQVIEMELNLVYDVFYTKASKYRLVAVRLVRYFTLVLEIAAFGCLAYSKVKKEHAFITYSLVLGVLFMDTVATLGVIFSIRTIVPADDDRWINGWLHSNEDEFSFFSSLIGWILNKLLNMRRRTWGKHPCTQQETSFVQIVRRTLFRRWSESIPQFNFVDYCLRRQPSLMQKVLNILGAKERIHKVTYVSYVWFTNSLRDFVFHELQSKAMLEHPRRHSFESTLDTMLSGFYSPWVAGRELDECLLVWHIATDLIWTRDSNGGGQDSERCQWSKTLSDYMLCLLIQHADLLMQGEVGLMGKIRLESACEKAMMSLPSSPSYFNWIPRANGSRRRHHEARCRVFDRMKRNMDEMDQVVCEGCRLAERLEEMGNNKWEIVSKVWVELLCRAASESKPSAHIRRLSTGGEFFTQVWLLMNHLEIGDWGKPCRSALA